MRREPGDVKAPAGLRTSPPPTPRGAQPQPPLPAQEQNKLYHMSDAQPIASTTAGRSPIGQRSYFRLADGCGGSCAQREAGEVMMAAVAVRGGRPCCRWVPALMRERPCRLQHQQAAVQSDLPIEMENPYEEPLKKCVLCGINVDYKNVQLLSQFVSPYSGRIYGRHITGLCDKKQKEISKAIKRAHILGFMPVMFKNPSFLTDPKICNVKY